MTLPIERARSRRPITWLTLLGVLLLPALVGGVLVAALYNPTERLDTMTAAIVNDDEPVTIDGQYTPLGRQLSAGLVEGSDDVDSNLTWVLSNADDAAAGLEDSTYQAVVTIPENFSAAAMSSGQSLSGGAEEPEQATIEVTTPPDALVVDDAITAQVAQAAATTMSESLSSLTLENVFLGFTDLGSSLNDAASGAHDLADGAAQAADGAAALPDGAAQLADGATGLSAGADDLAAGLDALAEGADGAVSGVGQLAAGIDDGADRTEAAGVVPAELTALADTGVATSTATAQSAGGTAQSAGATAQAAGGLSATLQGLSAQCLAEGGSAAFCASLADATADAGALATSAGATATSAGGTASSAVSSATAAAYTQGGLSQFSTAAGTAFADQLRGIADTVRSIAPGLQQLASGIEQSSAGATALGDGADQLAAGGTELATGSRTLADGVAELASGTSTLADGLDEASTALPSYTDAQAQNLAQVASTPVTADGSGSSLFGASAIPLLATLALWFGGLASFIVMQAATRRALTSRRSSATLTLRAFAPGAAIGAAQGLLVAGVVQLAASYDAGTWWAFAGLSVLAGVAFAAVNQALVAVFGGAGRWISALVGVLAVATGIVSTVPGVLSGLAGVLPTAPAYHAMVGALASAGGVAAGVVGLVLWSLAALAATTIAVAVRRTTSARALLAASPA